jgi:hypothetical protein
MEDKSEADKEVGGDGNKGRKRETKVEEEQSVDQKPMLAVIQSLDRRIEELTRLVAQLTKPTSSSSPPPSLSL